MIKRLLLVFIIVFFSLQVSASDFSVHKLPNGQILIIKEIKTNPIVTVDTWVQTGSINETDSNSGVSHFLEHLFFKGTKLHPAGEFDRILESKGAIVNAATSKDFTHYYITLPSEYLNTAIELHADMLSNPQIPRKELEKERKVVLEEISKDINTPAKKVYDNLNELMYTQHPYKRKVIGTEEVISNISREEILEYFNKFYGPSNMITMVVGNVDTDSVVKKVSESFNQKCKKSLKKRFKQEHPLISQKRKIEYSNTQTGYMMIGFRGVPIAHGDTYALDVLNQILGGGRSSRLYKSVKEQKGLVYSVSASNASFRDDGIIVVNSSFNPLNCEKIEREIFNEISAIQKYGVTDEELNIAKKIIEQDTYYSRESTSNIASELGYTIALTGNTDFYTNYLANINKVNVKDVQSVAQKYLGVNKSAVSILLPPSVKNEEITKSKVHTAQKVSQKDGIEKYIIDNQSTLLLNNHKNNDIIAITILAKGGEFIEKTIGEGTLTSATMLKGTKKYSAQELAKIMEENGIKIKPSCGEDTFSIVVQTTTSALDLTLDILDEIINNAVFDEYELEKNRTELMGKIKQKRDVPMNLAVENFKTLIFENSVYSHTNKIIEKHLPSVTRDDVMAYYNKIFDAKNVIVSVNGNADPETMINSFGAILHNSNSPEFKYANHSIEKIKSQKHASETIPNLQTAWLFLGWQTAGSDNKKDFVTLKVLNTIMGSGMSSRLFRNLREQDGLAYQLGSKYSPHKLGGAFITYIGTNPETLDYSKTRIKQEVERLKKEFVTDKELNDAKERLKGGFIVAMETNSDKATTTGNFEALGFGYDFMPEYIKMIDNVTASDILNVANKYFNDRYVESIVK